MSAPGWSRWILVGLMMGITGYHLVRLLAGKWRRNNGRIDLEVTHLAMAATMTAMLAGALAPTADRLLTIVFAAAALRLAATGIHSYIASGPTTLGGRAQQVAGCAAMAYMLAAFAHAHPMAAMGTTAIAVLPLRPLFVGAIAAVTVASLRQFRIAPAGPGAGRALAVGCQFAMNATTVFMLVSR